MLVGSCIRLSKPVTWSRQGGTLAALRKDMAVCHPAVEWGAAQRQGQHQPCYVPSLLRLRRRPDFFRPQVRTSSDKNSSVFFRPQVRTPSDKKQETTNTRPVSANLLSDLNAHQHHIDTETSISVRMDGLPGLPTLQLTVSQVNFLTHLGAQFDRWDWFVNGAIRHVRRSPTISEKMAYREWWLRKMEYLCTKIRARENSMLGLGLGRGTVDDGFAERAVYATFQRNIVKLCVYGRSSMIQL